MLFFLCFGPTIKFSGGSPVDPLFEPPADSPFDSTSYRHFGVSEKKRQTFNISRKGWEKLNRGGSKPGGFPLFSGKVQIVSQTLSGLFLVGAANRLRTRKRTNRENPRRVPGQIGKITKKSGKSQKGQERTKKEGQVQIGKPRLKPPRLAALEKGL